MKKIKKFKTCEEFFDALKTVKPCDLRDEKTTVEDAVIFCKEIMTYFVMAEDCGLPDHDKLVLILSRLGACEVEKAAIKFSTDKNPSVENMLSMPNNILFPLNVFNQIFKTKKDDYKFTWYGMVEGGAKYSWIGEWLASQSGREQESV